MKQTSKQEAFRAALDYACSMWKTGAMSIDKAAKLAAKKHKVNAKELIEYMLRNTQNKPKE